MSEENRETGVEQAPKEETLLARLANIRKLHLDIASEHLKVEGVNVKSPTSASRHSAMPGQHGDLSAEFARRKQSTDVIMQKVRFLFSPLFSIIHI